MHHSIKLSVLFFSLILGLNACMQECLVVYRPHYLSANAESKSLGDPELDSIEFINTIQVLDYYGEDYRIRNRNIILVHKQLSNDWDLMWNYTSKANDASWLNEHKVD